MSSTLDLLGGPFSPQSLVGEIVETTTPTVVDGTVFPFDPDKMPGVNPVTGVPDLIAAPPPMPTPPSAAVPDDSQGGSVATDPTEEVQAAKDALEKEPKSAAADSESDGSVALPEHRGFDDQTFILMHAYNLINLRNEKMNFDLDEPPPDKLDDVDGDKKPDDVMSNTIRSIKSGLPYAYIEGEDSPETNAVIQCIGDPGGFVNYLTATPNLQSYIDASPAQLSNLASKIRFYKIFHKDGKEEIVEFAFETAGMGASELETMMSSRGRQRGYGVGIKTFNMSFLSTDSSTAKTLVSGDLILYGSSMESFLSVKRGVGESKDLEYRFMDLAYKTTSPRGLSNNIPKGHTDDLGFEIVADVGLATAGGISGLTGDATSLTVKLKPHGHNFEFQQDGSVTLTIEFKGYLDTTFSSPAQFDVFMQTKDVERDLKIELGAAAITKDCGAKEAARFRLAQVAKGNKEYYRSRIINLNKELRKRGKIYYINIAPEVMNAFNDVFNSYTVQGSPTENELARNRSVAGKAVMMAALGTRIPLSSMIEEELGLKAGVLGSAYTNISNPNKQAKSMQNDMEEKAPPQSTIRDCAVDPNSNQIPYFYVSDLINIILDNLTTLYRKENIVPIIEKLLTEYSSDESALDRSEFLGISQETARGDTMLTENNDAVNNITINADKLKKLRVVLGPTTVKDFFTENEIVCSIGDIPVPLKHFNSWLVGEMEGSKRVRYPLAEFITDFIKDYLKLFLRGNTKYNDVGNLGMSKIYSPTNLFGYKSHHSEYDTDPLTLLRHSDTKAAGRKSVIYQLIDNDYRPLIKTSSNKILNKSKKEGFDYMIFHEPRSSFAVPKTNDQLANMGIGVYQLGKDRGILKEINFTRLDNKDLQAAHMASQEGSQDGLAQLTQIFDATLTMYLNLNVYVGQFIYIDPNSVTSYLSAETRSRMSKLTQDMLGVGGFFFVNAVHHSFEQGRFETTLNTQWQPSANKYTDEEMRKKPETEEQPTAAPNEPNNDRYSGCKSAEEGPNNNDQNNTAQQARAVSESLFGGIVDSAVGLFKAMFDNSDAEITVEEVENITGKLGSKTVSNPNQGNQGSANNGPKGA